MICVTEQNLKEQVFASDFEFCLLDERARILNEVGHVIATKFNSSFTKFVEASNYDAPTFVNLVVECLSGFRDEAIYNGRQVFFYKRAQILCADLIGAYNDIGAPVSFKNAEQLTMFADYRVP